MTQNCDFSSFIIITILKFTNKCVSNQNLKGIYFDDIFNVQCYMEKSHA